MSTRKITSADCQSCGICCSPEASSRDGCYGADYVEVTNRDLKRMSKALSAEEIGDRVSIGMDDNSCMKLVPKNGMERCAALTGRIGRSCACSIYEVRPGVCREFKPGSEECLEARKNYFERRRGK